MIWETGTDGELVREEREGGELGGNWGGICGLMIALPVRELFTALWMFWMFWMFRPDDDGAS